MAQVAHVQASSPESKIAADFDALDIADPFAFYARARAEEPVFYDPATDYWVVSRYDDVKAIFDNWQGFSSELAQAPVKPYCDAAKAVLKAGGFTAYSGLSGRIPPDHTRIRKIAQTAFSPRRFKAIEPEIRAIMTSAIDKFAARGTCEFVKEFSYDVPALVILTLLGAPLSDVANAKRWAESRAMLTWGDGIRRRASAALSRYGGLLAILRGDRPLAACAADGRFAGRPCPGAGRRQRDHRPRDCLGLLFRAVRRTRNDDQPDDQRRPRTDSEWRPMAKALHKP